MCMAAGAPLPLLGAAAARGTAAARRRRWGARLRLIIHQEHMRLHLGAVVQLQQEADRRARPMRVGGA